MIGAENAILGLARDHAALELLEAALVDDAERLDLHGFTSFLEDAELGFPALILEPDGVPIEVFLFESQAPAVEPAITLQLGFRAR
jgi:hypothetical protein